MAYRISIPFYAFKLHMPAGVQYGLPMTDKQAFFIGQPLHLIADKYAEALQREVLNKGDLRQLLDEFRPGEFFMDRLEIDFPKSKDGLMHPAFSISFDFFFNRQPTGFWGVIPALGVESFARDLPQLSERLAEAIRLDFVRQRRFSAVQPIVSAMWIEATELLQHEIELSLPSPREIEDLLENQQEQWLPLVAQKLEIDRKTAYGRKPELDQIAQALKNKFTRNVLLVGPAGVGKTALVWEISRELSRRKIKGVIWESTASILIKELTRETGWQDNLAFLCKELAQTNDWLFIRNLMELFEVGHYEGNSMSIADYLRSYLSRGEVSVISECTEEEMARIELKSPNYLSLFHVIRVEEPRDKLEQIILSRVQALARDKDLSITEDAIREVIRLNRRFMPYSGLPGKPIRFLEGMLINKKRQQRQAAGQQPATVTQAEVVSHFSEESGMPRFMLDPEIPMQVATVKSAFQEQVFGQPEAVDAVVDLLASVKTALTRSGKPIASFLFLGPTGVGKTQLAKVLAGFMFGSKDRLTRFDMSEYSTPYGVMRLLGTDYFSEGLLTSAIRREPFSVLLFDEVEKAHPNFFDLLLQILGEGRLTDNQGKVVNFCSTIIIMTSNLGAEQLQGGRISWNRELSTGDVREHFIGAARKQFRPELFNRIDQIIPFFPLNRMTIRHIVDRELNLLRQREGIRFRRMELRIDDKVLDYLGTQGYDSKYGARHLQRALREKLIIPLSKGLNAEDIDDQLLVKVVMEENRLQVLVTADPLGLELLIEELDMITNADHAGKLRRQIYRLLEGPVYVRLLNDLALLERQRTKQRRKFWKNQQQVEQYNQLLQTRATVKQLTNTIEDLENDLCLASLGQKPYDSAKIEALEDWEEALFELKLEIYARLTPEANHCHLLIYGPVLGEIFPFYLALCRRRNYDFTIHALWFRGSVSHEGSEEASEAEGVQLEIKKSPYVKTELKAEELSDLEPPRRGDLFCGVELRIKGPACFLYFLEEKGIQRWQVSENEDVLFVVEVENGPSPTPEKIHRKEFFTRQQPRRTVEPETVRDVVYRLNRELKMTELVNFLGEELDKRFRAKIDLEVL